VVDHAVHVRARTVEQPDDGHVHVPPLVGMARADALRGLLGIPPGARPSPAVPADEAAPGAREDAPGAGREEREGADREMAVPLLQDEIADGGAFVARETMRHSTRARRSVVERAGDLAAPPRSKPPVGEPGQPEHACRADDLARVGDRLEQALLARALRQT